MTWRQSACNRSSHNLWVINYRLVNRTDSCESIRVNSSECCWRHSSWNLVNTVHSGRRGSRRKTLSSGWVISLRTLTSSSSTNSWSSAREIFVAGRVERDNTKLSFRSMNAGAVRKNYQTDKGYTTILFHFRFVSKFRILLNC